MFINFSTSSSEHNNTNKNNSENKGSVRSHLT